MKGKNREKLRWFLGILAAFVGSFLVGRFLGEMSAAVDLLLAKFSDAVLLLLSTIGVI